MHIYMATYKPLNITLKQPPDPLGFAEVLKIQPPGLP